MSFWSIILSGIIFFWDLLREWLFIFISPIKNVEILWIIIPIWISWFFGEFFQEKKGTSFGNAISNGVVPLFVGLDWTRYLTTSLIEGKIQFDFWSIIPKYIICGLVIAYGIAIIVFGIRGMEFIRYCGRIREITYVLVVFSPVIYQILELNLRFLLIVTIFFPVYYFFIEFIDKITPDPQAYKIDEKQNEEAGRYRNNAADYGYTNMKSDYSYNRYRRQL